MFARGEMKRVAFATRDVDAQAITKYRPGENNADLKSTRRYDGTGRRLSVRRVWTALVGTAGTWNVLTLAIFS